MEEEGYPKIPLEQKKKPPTPPPSSQPTFVVPQTYPLMRQPTLQSQQQGQQRTVMMPVSWAQETNPLNLNGSYTVPYSYSSVGVSLPYAYPSPGPSATVPPSRPQNYRSTPTTPPKESPVNKFDSPGSPSPSPNGHNGKVHKNMKERERRRKLNLTIKEIQEMLPTSETPRRMDKGKIIELALDYIKALDRDRKQLWEENVQLHQRLGSAPPAYPAFRSTDLPDPKPLQPGELDPSANAQVSDLPEVPDVPDVDPDKDDAKRYADDHLPQSPAKRVKPE